jgi:hypothetical protein
VICPRTFFAYVGFHLTHSLSLTLFLTLPSLFLSSRFSSLLVSSSRLFSPFLFFLMSTLLPDDIPPVDLEDMDDDDLHNVSASHMSWGNNASHLSGAVNSASTWSLTTPSQVSQPSGFPIDGIARLTHDELCHNPEFKMNVGIIFSLQELLSLREEKKKRAFSRIFFCFFVLLFFSYVFF